MKKVLSIVLTMSMSLALTPSVLADEIFNSENAVQPSQVVYDVLNDEGTYENQEILSLDINGTLPEYITDVTYLDNSNIVGGRDITIEDSVDKPEDFPTGDKLHEPQNTAVAYAVTKNESESNNSYTTADPYNDGENMNGVIGSLVDEDWFKVYWAVDGKVDFYLENIPSTCNYNLKVYSQPKSGGSLTLYKTAATTSRTEKLLAVPVTNDKNYYMQVYSTKGYSTAVKYLLRAVNTRVGDTFEPNDTFSDAKTISKNSTANGTIHKAEDVDYYKVSATNGILSVRLSTIPVGKDYRFAVYNSSQKLVYETEASGSTEKKANIPVSSGTYYVKVFSNLGYNVTSKYTLTLSHRSPYTTVNGLIAPVMKPEGGAATKATPIANLPIKIVYTTGTGTTQTVLASTTTNSSGGFSVSFNLPANVKHLYVKTTTEDNTLSVQNLDKNVTAFLYEIPYNAATVSMSIGNSLTDQMRASYSIWNHAKAGLTSYKAVSGKSASRLVIRCTAGSGEGSNYNYVDDRIVVAGVPDKIDYYDRDVIMHEMGHWEMYHNGGRPSADPSGSHNWSEPSKLPTAYSEGWANYFSCVLRNDPYLRDFNSSNKWFGGNLSTGQVKPSYGWDTMQTLASLNPYSDNAKREVNVGATLWNIDEGLSKSFNDLDAIARDKSNSFIEYYNKFMRSISSSQKEEAWSIFNKFNVAFDMNVPEVTVSVSGLTASMTATDDVAVKRYEWYIDNALRKEGTGSSGSINLADYGLSEGTHTLECRVYDPEGVTTSPLPRPREERYGSGNSAFVIAKSSVNRLAPDTETIADDSSSQDDSQSSLYAPAVTLQPHISEAMEEIMDSSIQVQPASAQYIDVVSSGDDDLYLYFNSSSAVKSYKILTPGGEPYDEFNFIAADTPYIVANAEEGIWKVEIEGYGLDETLNLLEAQGLNTAEWTLENIAPVDVSLVVGRSPQKLDITLPDVSNDPRILAQYFDKDITACEDGIFVDLSDDLSDGIHTLTFYWNGMNIEPESEVRTLLIDTVLPAVEIDEFPKITSRNRFVLTAKFSENIARLLINGVECDLGECDRNFLAECIELSPGMNNFALTFYDYAGNMNTAEVNVFREV